MEKLLELEVERRERGRLRNVIIITTNDQEKGNWQSSNIVAKDDV